jgi:hypothetical protein
MRISSKECDPAAGVVLSVFNLMEVHHCTFSNGTTYTLHLGI